MSWRRPGNVHWSKTNALATVLNHQLIAFIECQLYLCVQLGKMRMKIPCRAVTCDHIQCFDAITYLRMNEKKPTWFCPVCDRHADYSKLIIDGFVTQLFTKVAHTTREIKHCRRCLREIKQQFISILFLVMRAA